MSEKKTRSLFSVSCGASVLMALYVSAAAFNLYKLMFPLAFQDLSVFPPSSLVRPLWSKGAGEEMHLRVYLSTHPRFGTNFLQSEFPDEESNQVNKKEVELLWDEELKAPAFSKSFLLTTLDCDKEQTCSNDDSYQYAASWLDEAQRMALGSDDVLSVMSAAGQGIESTSILLTAYQSLSKQIRKLLVYLKLVPQLPEDETKQTDFPRTTVVIPKASPLWSALRANAWQKSTLYVHVLVVREARGIKWPPTTLDQASKSLRMAHHSHSLLLGQVGMTKWDTPVHMKQPGRILLNDLVYWWKRYFKGTREFPPWEMAYYKPEENRQYEKLMEMKKQGTKYPYWKPEVSIKYVSDDAEYPLDLSGASGMPLVQVAKSAQHPTGYAFTPALHVDEIGMTSEKYIPINETLTSLPLRISFDRSDMEHHTSRTTATSGGLSPARWRLLSHLSEAIEAQSQLGFEQSDIDDVRRLVADTNITLLAITMFASAMHLLFEFLTFKSEVSFWQNNKDLTGLSVRALFLDMISQTIILLFLIEKDSSLLMTVPSAVGCLIALWKCQRASGLKFVRAPKDPDDDRDRATISWWNQVLRRLTGYELRATRLEVATARPSASTKTKASEKSKTSPTTTMTTREKLRVLTIESDRIATRTLGLALLPLVVAYSLYSLAYEEHAGWYSWLISSASSAVYALGFCLMTPQLFLNWKLKSVAHLPWRVLVYRSLNTFIDDLFSFIIRMPTMARISCFRDDIVFFIYLYQRWLYPVDTSRPAEGGGDAGGATAKDAKDADATKKNQ